MLTMRKIEQVFAILIFGRSAAAVAEAVAVLGEQEHLPNRLGTRHDSGNDVTTLAFVDNNEQGPRFLQTTGTPT